MRGKKATISEIAEFLGKHRHTIATQIKKSNLTPLGGSTKVKKLFDSADIVDLIFPQENINRETNQEDEDTCLYPPGQKSQDKILYYNAIQAEMKTKQEASQLVDAESLEIKWTRIIESIKSQLLDSRYTIVDTVLEKLDLIIDDSKRRDLENDIKERLNESLLGISEGFGDDLI